MRADMSAGVIFGAFFTKIELEKISASTKTAATTSALLLAYFAFQNTLYKCQKMSQEWEVKAVAQLL